MVSRGVDSILLVYQAHLQVVKVGILKLILYLTEFSALFLFSHIGLRHGDRVSIKTEEGGLIRRSKDRGAGDQGDWPGFVQDT